MTATELKSALISCAAIIDAAQPLFPTTLDQKVVQFLNGLDANGIQTLENLFQVPATTIQANVQSSATILTSVNTLFTNGQAADISAMCKSLANRPVVLALITRFA